MKKCILPLLSSLLLLCACQPYGGQKEQKFTINKDNYDRYYWFATYEELDGIYVEINRRSEYFIGENEVLKFAISYDYIDNGVTTRKTKDVSFNVGTNSDFVYLTGERYKENPKNIVPKTYSIAPIEVSGTCVIDYHYFKKVDLSTITKFPDYSAKITSYTDINGKVSTYGSTCIAISYDKITSNVLLVDSVTIAFYQSIFEDDPEEPIVKTYTHVALDGFIYEESYIGLRLEILDIRGYLYIY